MFDEIDGNGWPYSILYGLNGLYVLDELINLPLIYKKPITSGIYNLSYLCRLKRCVFKQYDFPLQMKSQTLDLSKSIGYFRYIQDIINYSKYHGITEATLVTDDASYQALKDNPD